MVSQSEHEGILELLGDLRLALCGVDGRGTRVKFFCFWAVKLSSLGTVTLGVRRRFSRVRLKAPVLDRVNK